MITLSSQVQDDILIITFSGILQQDAPTAIGEFLRIVESSGLRKILVDTRQLEGRLSVADTYFTTGQIFSEARSVTTAIVEKPENMAYAEFHRLAMHNVGYRNLSLFFDYDEALDFLRKV